jgi:hypothetical protein
MYGCDFVGWKRWTTQRNCSAGVRFIPGTTGLSLWTINVFIDVVTVPNIQIKLALRAKLPWEREVMWEYKNCIYITLIFRAANIESVTLEAWTSLSLMYFSFRSRITSLSDVQWWSLLILSLHKLFMVDIEICCMFVYHILGSDYAEFARHDIGAISERRAKNAYQYQHACKKCIPMTSQWKVRHDKQVHSQILQSIVFIYNGNFSLKV